MYIDMFIYMSMYMDICMYTLSIRIIGCFFYYLGVVRGMELAGLDLTSMLNGMVSLGVVLSIFVEITPIKINPVSTLLKFIGSNINADFKAEISAVKTEIETTKESVQKIDNKVDNNEIDRIRWEILDFANTCRNKRKHTREEFLHIIALNEKYHKILDERGETNGQIDIEYDYIESIYRKCLENNSFLCANGDDDC